MKARRGEKREESRSRGGEEMDKNKLNTYEGQIAKRSMFKETERGMKEDRKERKKEEGQKTFCPPLQ